MTNRQMRFCTCATFNRGRSFQILYGHSCFDSITIADFYLTGCCFKDLKISGGWVLPVWSADEHMSYSVQTTFSRWPTMAGSNAMNITSLLAIASRREVFLSRSVLVTIRCAKLWVDPWTYSVLKNGFDVLWLWSRKVCASLLHFRKTSSRLFCAWISEWCLGRFIGDDGT